MLHIYLYIKGERGFDYLHGAEVSFTQLVKNFLPFVGPKDLLPSSQEPATGHYDLPVEPSLHPVSLRSTLILSFQPSHPSWFDHR
jgi:hypothetical protein